MSHRALAISLAAALLAGAPLGAQSPVSFDVGTYATYTRFDRSLFLADRPGFGARVGMGIDAGHGPVRLEAEFARTSSDRLGTNTVYAPARMRVVYPIPVGTTGRMTLLLGAGGVRTRYSGGSTTNVDYGFSGLAALHVHLAGRIALRIDGSTDYMSAPANEAPNMPNNWNSVLGLGLSMPLGRSAPAPRPEAPPLEPVMPEPLRSPADGDADGVVDASDACPASAPGERVDLRGCATLTDSDADGVVDGSDRCPATPRGTAIDGQGCPLPADSDRDGVADPSDRCPESPLGARVDTTGCSVESDADGDAVVDSRDRCPDTAAGTTVDGTGCPPLFERTTRTITLRGVTFPSGRAELTPASLATVERLAAQLLESPEVRIEVAGHTDASGARTANIRLSLQRAESVRAQLVALGVAPDRLIARGYGPDEPAGSNATPDGRAMNRRVELRRID